jgi:hypothetical protein
MVDIFIFGVPLAILITAERGGQPSNLSPSKRNETFYWSGEEIYQKILEKSEKKAFDFCGLYHYNWKYHYRANYSSNHL